jgi:hypothetical protein
MCCGWIHTNHRQGLKEVGWDLEFCSIQSTLIKNKEGTRRSSLSQTRYFWSVLWIRIRMFLGLPDPDSVVRRADPNPSIIKQIERKTLLLLFCDFFMTFYF